MPEIALETLLQGWVAELHHGFAFPPPDFFSKTQQATHNAPVFVVRVNERGALVLRQERQRAEIEMGRYMPFKEKGIDKSFVLLNGDGFENAVLQVTQRRVREQIRQRFPFNRAPNRPLIAPYAALNSAGLNLDSIRPIHVSVDRNQRNRVEVPAVPLELMIEHVPSNEPGQRQKEFEYEGRRYMLEYSRANTPPQSMTPDQLVGQSIKRIRHRAEFDVRERWLWIEQESPEKWFVIEQVHRLGSSVFSAEGADGRRHRWLSSFDQNENPPMYFLAQIPDRGGVRYVTHAINALAPVIVHQARMDKKVVRRQGDIFFVQTDLKDEDFGDAVITRRDQVFETITFQEQFTTDVSMNATASATITTTAVGVGAVPITTTFSNTNQTIERMRDDARSNLRLRRGIQIYGTGHTADVVAVTKRRGTFVKGVVYHDPILENIRGNRQPEHARLTLPENIWFLAVRNTVPRQSDLARGDSDAGMHDMSRDEPQQERNVPEPQLS